METNYYMHPSSDVSPKAVIGNGTKIWQHCQVREDAVLGSNCILSKGVYIDFGVHIGNNVKIQNGISVYHGVTLEDGVFCGPHCVFTNDKQPRSINPDGTLKSADDWVLSETLVRKGAAIGAHATIVCGIDHRPMGDGRSRFRCHSRCSRLWLGLWQSGSPAWLRLPLWGKVGSDGSTYRNGPC
jgi:acetyltransferase-like isoleucine patch superfamily enzyme